MQDVLLRRMHCFHLPVRLHDDFESAVLHAVNGGGQNQVRVILAGTLTDSRVGLSGIPNRFLKGLEKADELKFLSKRLASLLVLIRNFPVTVNSLE